MRTQTVLMTIQCPVCPAGLVKVIYGAIRLRE
jgi:hypothetical protein